MSKCHFLCQILLVPTEANILLNLHYLKYVGFDAIGSCHYEVNYKYPNLLLNKIWTPDKEPVTTSRGPCSDKKPNDNKL
jgi:hypothetical protein